MQAEPYRPSSQSNLPDGTRLSVLTFLPSTSVGSQDVESHICRSVTHLEAFFAKTRKNKASLLPTLQTPQVQNINKCSRLLLSDLQPNQGKE